MAHSELTHRLAFQRPLSALTSCYRRQITKTEPSAQESTPSLAADAKSRATCLLARFRPGGTARHDQQGLQALWREEWRRRPGRPAGCPPARPPHTRAMGRKPDACFAAVKRQSPDATPQLRSCGRGQRRGCSSVRSRHDRVLAGSTGFGSEANALTTAHRREEASPLGPASLLGLGSFESRRPRRAAPASVSRRASWRRRRQSRTDAETASVRLSDPARVDAE